MVASYYAARVVSDVSPSLVETRGGPAGAPKRRRVTNFSLSPNLLMRSLQGADFPRFQGGDVSGYMLCVLNWYHSCRERVLAKGRECSMHVSPHHNSLPASSSSSPLAQSPGHATTRPRHRPPRSVGAPTWRTVIALHPLSPDPLPLTCSLYPPPSCHPPSPPST